MEGIRLATEAEIERIQKESDLGPTSSVIAWGKPEAPDTIIAVQRLATEIDPLYWSGASANKKRMFMWGVENMMRYVQVPAYYFNIQDTDEFKDFRELVMAMEGTEQVSKQAEIRYKRTL